MPEHVHTYALTIAHASHRGEAARRGGMQEPLSLSLVCGFSVPTLCLCALLTEGPAGRQTTQHLPAKAQRRAAREKVGSDPREQKTRHLGNQWIRIGFIFKSFAPRAVTRNKSKELPGLCGRTRGSGVRKQIWLGGHVARLLAGGGGGLLFSHQLEVIWRTY